MPRRLEIKEGDILHGLEVIKELPSELQGKDKKRTFLFKCNCGDIFKSTLNRVNTGNTRSCGCKFKYPTPRHRRFALEEKLKETNLIIDSDNEITNGLYRVKLSCKSCGLCFTRDFNSLISKTVCCSKCNGNYRVILTERDLIVKLGEALENTTLFFIRKYEDKPLRTNSDIVLKCSSCNNEIKRRYSVARDLKLPCPCKTVNGFDQTSKAHLYLIAVKSEGVVVAYKYGITKNIRERFLAIKRKCIYDLSLFMYWDYELGRDALIHEAVFKKLYPAFLEKELMLSGNTETIPPEQLEEFLLIQSTQYADLIGEQSWI